MHPALALRARGLTPPQLGLQDILRPKPEPLGLDTTARFAYLCVWPCQPNFPSAAAVLVCAVSAACYLPAFLLSSCVKVFVVVCCCCLHNRIRPDLPF